MPYEWGAIACRDILAKKIVLNARVAEFPMDKPSFVMPYTNPEHDVDVSNVRALQRLCTTKSGHMRAPPC